MQNRNRNKQNLPYLSSQFAFHTTGCTQSQFQTLMHTGIQQLDFHRRYPCLPILFLVFSLQSYKEDWSSKPCARLQSSVHDHLWCDCLNHKKIGTERATCTRTTTMGYYIANVFLSIEYCSIEYLHTMPCLWCMQPATKTFLHHITNMSPFIKKVRHINLICNKETDERSRFSPISTR